ncbi:MAG: hypothetical protein FD164_1392 [Nitrospirae bacterium]|nr:MAG: hypothetical protein FD164_1392 [Nitrospirota bacterium]
MQRSGKQIIFCAQMRKGSRQNQDNGVILLSISSVGDVASLSLVDCA